ncbi:MAG: chromosome partitioning protein ParB [Halieaceae bacterium MED-G27]|jgi:ParB family chromosome partitioning protein|nr:chromosome partitioning protein ParB [Halieaceae bacterium]OUT64389.1 MAG: chromosome partitioning protein ParB [Cellvibrionales bacterium TMED21]PDH37582.1 MAG: chromosome partitioning protein ParB [Halieaceae bacterium MED-G27]|tara:strand:- start:547 stop:1413 length:867 start_codon:yes stop_codon:yes gene_type:complete
MTTRKRKLNRGLDALLGSELTPSSGERSAATGDSELKQLPVEFLQRGQYQPRRDFDQEALQELADSIRAQGVMQPIVVRQIGNQRYEIIAGERRWRACQLAGQADIPALVRDVSDEAAIAMALIENIQRENLNPIEEAMALRRLQTEFSLSQQDVATAVGKSRSVVANLLRLLSLESEVLDHLQAGLLDTGHAKVLLALEGTQQIKSAKQVIDGQLSVRQTEALVKALLKATDQVAQAVVDPNIARLSRELSEMLGTQVSIDDKKGRGKIVIQYPSLDVLDGILRKIR